jgi:hemolysin III
MVREPFNSISHLSGAAIVIPAAGILLVRGGDTSTKAIPFAIYGISLFFMFLASGLYHASEAPPKIIERLRKIDHSAIYLLIAGTYTPFCAIAFSGFWRWGLLAVIWTLAFAGIVIKMFIMGLPRGITAGIYVGMGWLSVFAAREFMKALSPWTLAWLLAGGLLYTAGAVVYATRKGSFFSGKFGFHEIWHLFVLAAAAAHFVAVASLA